MKLCIPVEQDLGLESQVYGHFGSAPLFLIVDTETMDWRTLVNNHQQHAHGMCQPVAAISGEPVDAIVVGGIGRGALMKLNAGGYQVYMAQYPSVMQTVEAFKKGSLPIFSPQQTCQGHGGQGDGCH